MTQLAKVKQPELASISAVDKEIISNIVLNGDLSKLTQGQKMDYYYAFCARIGVDAATRPFQLLKLNGKEELYCNRSGAAQLNKVHGVSHRIVETKEVRECWVVIAEASSNGRTETSTGIVSIAGLRGLDVANAMMKAETKAKRRSTLDLLGLGILDESELETIKAAKPVNIDDDSESDSTNKIITSLNNHEHAISICESLEELKATFKIACNEFKGDESAINKLTKIKDAMKESLTVVVSDKNFKEEVDDIYLNSKIGHGEQAE